MNGEAAEALKAIARFAIHTIVAVVLFGLIAAAAMLLHKLIILAVVLGTPDYVVAVLEAVEVAVFGIDVILFALFMLKEVALLARQIYLEIRGAYRNVGHPR